MSSQPQSVGTVKSIFADAVDQGVISLPTKDLLCVSLDDNVLSGCDGLDPDDLDANEVTLVTMLLDDSASMSGLEDAVIAGYETMIEAFVNSKQKDSFLIGLWALNRTTPYHSYVKVTDALRISRQNYYVGGMTPLCDRWCDLLASNLAYAQQLRSTGVAVRSIAVMITDSGDNASHKFTTFDCRQIAKDLLASEQFVLAMWGIKSSYYDFAQMAKEMGIPDGSVKTTGNDPSEVRRTFGLLSQSVIRASQACISTTQTQNQFFTP